MKKLLFIGMCLVVLGSFALYQQNTDDMAMNTVQKTAQELGVNKQASKSLMQGSHGLFYEPDIDDNEGPWLWKTRYARTTQKSQGISTWRNEQIRETQELVRELSGKPPRNTQYAEVYDHVVAYDFSNQHMGLQKNMRIAQLREEVDFLMSSV